MYAFLGLTLVPCLNIRYTQPRQAPSSSYSSETCPLLTLLRSLPPLAMEVPPASPSLLLLLVLLVSFPSSALLSPKGVNTEVQALIVIKNLLKDPHDVLKTWDPTSVDPCSWTMITCSPEYFVTVWELPARIFLAYSPRA